MMQMLKVNAEPNKAMMVAKDGIKIAIRMIMMQVTTRIAVRNIPLAYPGRPRTLLEGGTVLT